MMTSRLERAAKEVSIKSGGSVRRGCAKCNSNEDAFMVSQRQRDHDRSANSCFHHYSKTRIEPIHALLVFCVAMNEEIQFTWSK